MPLHRNRLMCAFGALDSGLPRRSHAIPRGWNDVI
jgi:hypothetical protein